METLRSFASITDVADLARRVLDTTPQLTRRQAVVAAHTFLARKAAEA